jgi:zinc protease
VLLVAGCVTAKGVVPVTPVTPAQASLAGVVPARVGGRSTRAETTLPNGVRVILEENHATPVIALQAWVAVGSADDPVELAGAAHFFEHLVARGPTADGTHRQLTREVAALGGEIDTWTSFDETVYAVSVASSFFDAAADLLAGALASPALDGDTIERERKALLAEIRQAQDDPARASAQALFAAAFGAHPYARPVLGTEATVGALGRAQLATFHERAFVGGNITVVVVGDFDAAAARAKITAAFGRLPRGPRLPARVHVPGRFDPPRVLAVARDVREPELALGFRIPAVAHQDIPALDLLAVVLGRGDGARLALEVVRNRQAASSARAYTFCSRDAGLLVLAARPSPARLEEAARAMLDEALRLGREEIPPEEVAKARTLLEGDLAHGQETPGSYARKLGFYRAVAGAPDGEGRYLQRLRALSAADLRAAAGKYLRVADLAVAAVLPVSAVGADAVARADLRLREVVKGAEARAEARAARAAPPATVEDVARFVLPSGLRVLVLRDGTVPVVSVEAVWRGGLRDEDARSNGISTLLAALLSRGTKTRSAGQIAADVGEMAGSLSGFAGRSTLGLRAEFLAAYWERGIELFADCLRNPSFSDDEIERERRVLLDRIRAQDDDPGQLALRLFQNTMWKRHPYRLDPLGTADTLASLSRRKLIDHYRHHYGVGGLTVAIVGDVDTARVVAKLSALLGDGPAATVVPATSIPPEPARSEAAEVFRYVAKDQAHVVVGYPGVAATDPDRFVLEVLARILAGPGGRLEVDLGERRALALRVDAFSLEGTDPGYFAVYLACGPERLDDAVQALRAELARVITEGVTAEEVASARRALVGAHAIALQRRGALAAALAIAEASGQGWGAYRSYPIEIDKVSPAEVQRVARRIFDDKQQIVAVVKPPDVTPALRAASGGGGRTSAP